MSYYSNEYKSVVWDLAGLEGHTESKASGGFGTNCIFPNHLLALVFSKGKEDFYDYDTFIKLTYFIVNNLRCYCHTDTSKESIQNAIEKDVYLRRFLKYDDFGVSIKNNVDTRPNYFHYQLFKLSEDDIIYVQAHTIDNLASVFMEKVIDHKDKVVLIKKVYGR